MSYLVFARKWRPLTFDDVVGQEHITDTLKKAIEKNRVAHAYIFTGTRGVGKTTSARILARALNCENGPTPYPCGVCTSCKDVIAGSSFDVLEIDGASNNSVDDIRELRDNIGYSSMGGKYRIFVIDEVHMLSKSAFNALLKTLEEPPKNVIFIFATTEPQKIPATIHSRCQRYDFKRIGAEHILGRLIHICTSENIQFERSALMLVARKAEGSMRDALSLLDQVYSFCHDTLNEKEVRAVLGLVSMDVYNRVIDSIPGRDAATGLKVVQDILFEGFDLQEFILGMQEHVRNLLFARIPGALESRGLEFEPEVIQKFSESAARFSEGDLLRMSEIVRKAEQDLRWSVYPRFLAELMVLKLVYLDSTVTLESLFKMLGGEQPLNDQTQLDSKRVPTESLDQKKKIVLEQTLSVRETTTTVSNDISPSDSSSEQIDLYESPFKDSSHDSPVSDSESLDDQSMYDDDDTDNENSDDDISNSPVGAAVVSQVCTQEVIYEGFNENPEEPLDLVTFWPSFLDHLIHEYPNLGSFLSLAYVQQEGKNTIGLKFAPSYRFQFLEVTKKHNRGEIQDCLRKFARRSIDLNITVDTNAAGGHEPNYIKTVGNISSTIEDEIEREPIIKTIMDFFDGEVLD